MIRKESCTLSPTAPTPVDKLNREGAGWQELASTPVSTQAPGQVGAFAHPPPFTRVVGLPQSNSTRHDSSGLKGRCCLCDFSQPATRLSPHNAYSLAVHGCSEADRPSYASLGGVGSSQPMDHEGFPYHQPHMSVLAADFNSMATFCTRGLLVRIVGEGK